MRIREIPHIASLLCSSISEVIAQAKVIVIANDGTAFRQVPKLMREDQVLIDLVGIARDNGNRQGVYEGICW